MAVQNKQLDKFHLKDNIQSQADDIQKGKILKSMQFEAQAQALKVRIHGSNTKSIGKFALDKVAFTFKHLHMQQRGRLALQQAMVTPLLRAKELLVKDINDHDDELDEPERCEHVFTIINCWIDCGHLHST